MDHEKIIYQQLNDQNIIEASEYGNMYGLDDDLDPREVPELLEVFIDERYTYDDEIPIGRRRGGIKGIKVS